MAKYFTDELIIDLFWSRDEKALQEFDKRYKTLCLQVAHNITGNNEDAQECLNDLYLRLWNTIPPEKPVSLKSYACEVVRNLALQCVRKQKAQKRSAIIVELEEVTHDIPYHEAENLGELIDAFLQKQSKLNAIIFVRRYYYSESVKDIAEKMGIAENKVSKILGKLRKSLREELKKGGIYI